MNFLQKIKENRKSIAVLAILIFNIPLAFGLVSSIDAANGFVSDGSYSTIINSPSTQNLFNIQSPETSKAMYNCEASLGTGIIPDLTGVGSNILAGVHFQTAACLEQTAGTTAAYQYTQQNQTGIINTVGNVQAAILEQRPLSTSYYIDQKIYALNNNGIVYAQDRGVAPAPYFPAGTGFQLLSPIQAFWGWSVNIVYGLLILIIIGIAFAIVFRNNLGGAQVVTIQSAIPSIALAMILVPLSYAISGIFIDGITIGTNVVHSFLLGPGAPGSKVYENRNQGRAESDNCVNETSDDSCDRGLYADDSRVNWFNVQKMVDVSDEVTEAAQATPDPLSQSGGSLINNWFVFKIAQGLLNILSGQAESPAYWFGEIINVFIGLTMIYIGIKILWKLFQKYLMLILMPIVSPFIFATTAVPGNGTKSIVEYVKLMASGTLSYVVVYAMFLLTIIFTSSAFQSQVPEISSGAFVPPLLGLSDIFTQGVGSVPLTHFIFTLVGLGIYFSIPNTLEQIDAALGVKSAIPAFIMTPIDSFRESTNVTFRAAQFGGRRLANAEQLRRTAVPQGYKSFRNRLDTLRGLNPGEAGTWQYGRVSELSKTKSDAQLKKTQAESVLRNPNASSQQRAQANADVRAANRAMKDVDREASRAGLEGVGYGKDNERPKITATFKWGNGSADNMIQFTAAEAKKFKDDFIAGGGVPIVQYKKGKIVLSANVPVFPRPISLKTAFVKGIAGTSDEEFDPAKEFLFIDGTDKKLKLDSTRLISEGFNPASRPSGRLSLAPMLFWDPKTVSNRSLSNIVDDTIVQLNINEGILFDPNLEGSQYEIPFDLVIKDPVRLFEIVTPNDAVLSKKIAFKVGQSESNVLKITMTMRTI